MIKEAIEYLFDQAREFTEEKRARKLNDFPVGERAFAYEHDGKITVREIPAFARKHKVDSVADLIAAAKKWNDEPVIWISRSQIVLVIDDNDRRELVTLPLNTAPLFTRIKELGEGDRGRLDQAVLLRLLRREFRHAAGAVEMLTAVRKVVFKSLETGQSTMNHGNESMGRSIEMEVTGAADIPDTLVVRSNVHSNPGELDVDFPITLDLEIDVPHKKFLLRPMPDEVDQAAQSALDDIHERIVAALPNVPVFFGTP